MEETAIISIPEIITISEQTNLKIYRSSTFVPESKLLLGERVKSIKLLSGERHSVITSEKGSKRILVYNLETTEELTWGDLKIELIMKGALNIDQIDYFVSRNNGCTDKCTIMAPVESDNRIFFICYRNGVYEELELSDVLPEGKIKIFFAK